MSGTRWCVANLSLGGLIVLITFLSHMPTSDCAVTFETLAKQLFPQPTARVSNFKRLRNLLTAWYHDGCHEAHKLEASLQENLGISNRLFGHSSTLISTKIGTTAATIDKGFPLLMTNYNGMCKTNKECGRYKTCLWWFGWPTIKGTRPFGQKTLQKSCSSGKREYAAFMWLQWVTSS